MASSLSSRRATAASPIHPVHGLLAAFPLAGFTGAFLTDIAYATTYQMMWADFSVWLITIGLVMGVLAAIVGIVDAIVWRRARMRPGWAHSIGTLVVLVVALVNVFVHSRDAYTSVMPTGLILSGITAILVVVTSWMGQTLAHRHVAGVA